jgi:hypothetical protein
LPALPNLRSLEVSCPGLALDGPALNRFLKGKDVPRLRTLTLRHTTDTARLLERIIDSPLGAMLERLSLPGGDLGDQAVPALKQRAARIEHLALLDLKRNPLSPAALKEISTVCMHVEGESRAPGAISEAQVLARASDNRSLAMARALAHPDSWLELGRDGDRLWGEYEGSDHYYVFAHLVRNDDGCSCPSPRDPCKHALALLLLAAAGHAFEERAPPAALARHALRERPRYSPTWE